jgi:hypothetical protein
LLNISPCGGTEYTGDLKSPALAGLQVRILSWAFLINIKGLKMTKIIFEIVKLRGIKNCKCELCNKSLRKQKTFSQTINPFNKNKKGWVKTKDEIINELKSLIETWKENKEFCENCLNSKPETCYNILKGK